MRLVVYLELSQLKQARLVFLGHYLLVSMLKFQIQNQVGDELFVIRIMDQPKLVLANVVSMCM